MRLWSISLRNLRIRLVATVLTTTSIVVATALYAAILVMAGQTRQRYEGAFSPQLAIMGPKDASQLEIVLNTIFNVGEAPALFPLKVAIDESLGRFATLYAAAGHPHCVFPTTLDELERLTGGVIAEGIGVESP